MNIFHDYKQSLMEDTDYEDGRATIHYQTHWTKEPMQKTYYNAKCMSEEELKAQHYKLFGGSITKIDRDHEYEPKKEKIHTTDKPGHLMDDIDAHVKPALDEESETLSEGLHLVLVNRHTGQRVVIKREHAELYPPRDGWQPISSVQTESTEIVNDTPKHLMTFKTTDEKGNSRHMHIYQKNDSNWYEIRGPVAMHANAVFLNGKIGDFEAEQHAHAIANMVGAGEHDRALEYLNKHSTMSWDKDYDQPEAETYKSQSLQTRSYRMNEAKHYLVGTLGQNLTGHTSKPYFNSEEEALEYQKTYKHAPAIKSAKVDKGTSDKHGFITPMNEASGREVISSKLKTMDAMRRVRIPTPQERRAEFEKQQREKEAEQQRLAKPTLAKEETDRMSQYVDLINQDLKNNRY